MLRGILFFFSSQRTWLSSISSARPRKMWQMERCYMQTMSGMPRGLKFPTSRSPKVGPLSWWFGLPVKGEHSRLLSPAGLSCCLPAQRLRTVQCPATQKLYTVSLHGVCTRFLVWILCSKDSSDRSWFTDCHSFLGVLSETAPFMRRVW